MAAKKAEVNVNNHKRYLSKVYVGNLNAIVDEEQLMEKFKSCGPIDEIIIRASSGVCVPTRNLPRPYFGFGAPLEGVHYATVQFSDPAGARRAITMNGRMFLGKPIVVSYTALDMPEITDILKKHILQKQLALAGVSLNERRRYWQAAFGQIKRLTIEKTEIIPDTSTTQSNASPAEMITGLAKRAGGLLMPKATRLTRHDALFFPAEARI
ncbi:hypothetical protein C8Q76DRAFT_380261 [Earliella scabrosa]|nr:hypothetical protein C8Q76DRAFT_380261 [Earliella scabrosa]